MHMKLLQPNEIDARTRVILEKITASQLAKNFPSILWNLHNSPPLI